jgi:hypothetical protein
MTDASFVAAITGTAAAILGWINRKQIQVANAHITETKRWLVEVGTRIDGRMSEQIELTRQIGFAAGVKHEKEDVKAEKAKTKPLQGPKK